MNNKLEVIGIDHGWSMMKTISQVFVTGVKEITTTPALFGDVLEYEGKFYKVGTVRQEVKDTKVEDDSFYLLTLAAVAKELKRRGHAESKELPICTYNEDGTFKEDIHYTVVETKAADGYILDETAHDVTLRYDDNAPDVVVATLKLVNVPTEPKLPQTGDNANPLLYLGIGAFALITGVGVGLRGRKKKNKQ